MSDYKLVSLGMYDLPETQHLTNAWWQGLSRHMDALGIEGLPPRLERTLDESQVWSSPDLLLSQTCGYPLALSGYQTLTPVLTPQYDVAGCEGSHYLSYLIVREDSPARELEDLRGRHLAVNSEQSNSGWRALRLLLESTSDANAFVQQRSISGSHRQSIEMVRLGQADYCSIDCVSHALLARYAASAIVGTRVLCHTPLSPGLPYVTSNRMDQTQLKRLREAVFNALEDPDLAEVREGLLIRGGEFIELDVYMLMAD
jgi:ABC-type phosphate/phosphonate transport system substrate-binding protein